MIVVHTILRLLHNRSLSPDSHFSFDNTAVTEECFRCSTYPHYPIKFSGPLLLNYPEPCNLVFRAKKVYSFNSGV